MKRVYLGRTGKMLDVYPGGGTGRHAGLKILFPAMQVWVQLPSRVLTKFGNH